MRYLFLVHNYLAHHLIVLTTDGGTNWNAMSTPTASNLNGLYFPTANTGYAVGNTGTIIKYTGSSGIWETVSGGNEINVYPNPASTSLTIHQSTQSSNQQLIITDILGNEVYKEMLTGIDNRISVSSWSNGVYFYQIRNDKETIQGKFVVEK